MLADQIYESLDGLFVWLPRGARQHDALDALSYALLKKKVKLHCGRGHPRLFR